MTKTHPCGLHAAPGIPERQIYCGPTALGAITGVAPVDVERAVLAERAKHGMPRGCRVLKGALVRAMSGSEIENVAAALGWRATLTEAPLYRRDCRSFARWCRTRGDTDAAYLVLVTNHFVAVRGDWFADTNARNPIPLQHNRYGRRNVVRVWRLDKVEA